jgi:hypothetical protein
MANTWVLLSAIKKVGTEPRKLLKELTTGSFSTPYWTEPLKVQPDGRQLMVRPDRRGGDEEAEWVLVSSTRWSRWATTSPPSFATKLERLSKPEYGVDYANEVMFVVPPSQTVESAKAYGCSLPSS